MQFSQKYYLVVSIKIIKAYTILAAKLFLEKISTYMKTYKYSTPLVRVNNKMLISWGIDILSDI